MPAMLVITQYIARPEGTDSENQANTAGIIQSIIWLVCAVCAFACIVALVIVSFCCRYMVTKTSITRMYDVSGTPRFSQRKWLVSGTACWTKLHGYSRCERSIRLSG